MRPQYTPPALCMVPVARFVLRFLVMLGFLLCCSRMTHGEKHALQNETTRPSDDSGKSESASLRIVSYEWSNVDVNGDTTSSPNQYEIDLVDIVRSDTFNRITAKYPGSQLDVMFGVPILRNDSSDYPLNMDARISVDMSNPTFADALLEINRQLNCNLLFGQYNKLFVTWPMLTRWWFPKGFMDEPIAERLTLDDVTFRTALLTIMELSSLDVRYTYRNVSRPNRYGSEDVWRSYLEIDFYDGVRLVSLPEHAMVGHDYVPAWVNEEDILSAEDADKWTKALNDSKNCGEAADAKSGIDE